MLHIKWKKDENGDAGQLTKYKFNAKVRFQDIKVNTREDKDRCGEGEK